MHANSLWNNWLLRLDLHDPEAGVDVRDVYQPARVDRAPGVRPVGYESGRVAGVHVSVLPALGQQVAFQLARDVEHSKAPLIVSHVQGVARDPDVVTAAVLRLEPRHFVGIGQIGDVDHVQPAVCATEPDNAGAATLLTRREHLVADADVPAVPPARVRAADEARAPGELDLLVELVQVVLVLQHELRILRRSTLHAVSDVQDDEAVVPVGQGRESVPDVDVMQHPSRFGALYLPAGHRLRGVGGADVDDPRGAGRVVGRGDGALVDGCAVDPPRGQL